MTATTAAAIKGIGPAIELPPASPTFRLANRGR
jgi:hypothetical protein